jgi:peptide deformylase
MSTEKETSHGYSDGKKDAYSRRKPMVLEIAQLGQPILRRVAAEVDVAEIPTPAFQQFIQDMLETLQAAEGAGLAGPQVFSSRRIFLACVLPPPTEEAPRGVEVFITPRITAASPTTRLAWEGCLSFPELLVLVERHLRVRIEYLDRYGEARTLELEDLPARVVQHEIDHLDGILTIDRACSTRHIIKASEIEAVLKAEKE